MFIFGRVVESLGMELRDRQALGSRIRLALERSGRSKEAVAREMGVKSGDIRRWIKGQHSPRIDALRALAKATKQDPDWFFADDDASKAKNNEPAQAGPSPYAARMGSWLEQLPDDVQTTLYVLGVCLSDPVERERLAVFARKALRRTGHDIPASAGIARTPPAAATRVAKRSKVSGR